MAVDDDAPSVRRDDVSRPGRCPSYDVVVSNNVDTDPGVAQRARPRHVNADEVALDCRSCPKVKVGDANAVAGVGGDDIAGAVAGPSDEFVREGKPVDVHTPP